MPTPTPADISVLTIYMIDSFRRQTSLQAPSGRSGCCSKESCGATAHRWQSLSPVLWKLARRSCASANQGCARLRNQRQHDSSYRLLAMDSSPQLPSGTNYTTSTIVPRSNRTHYQQNRTTAYQRHSRSWQAASRAPSSPSLEMLDIRKLNARGSNLMRYQVCITTDPVPTTAFQPYQLRRASGLDGSNLNQRQHDS